MLALDPSASGAVSLSNNATVATPTCSVVANSSSSSAVNLSNNTTITGPVTVHGGYSLSNGASLTGSPIVKNAPVTADPYAGVTVAAPPACTAQSGNISGNVSRTPGHFCSGFTISNNATLTLASGVYYLDSKFQTGNGVVIKATGGVTIIINGSYAISLGNNNVFNITAPATGPTAGMAIRGLSTNSSALTQDFLNNISVNIVGAIYSPGQSMRS